MGGSSVTKMTGQCHAGPGDLSGRPGCPAEMHPRHCRHSCRLAGPANLMAVTVELVLLSRVSYGSLKITGSQLQNLLALLADDLGGALAAARRSVAAFERRGSAWLRAAAHARIGEVCLEVGEAGSGASARRTPALRGRERGWSRWPSASAPRTGSSRPCPPRRWDPGVRTLFARRPPGRCGRGRPCH